MAYISGFFTRVSKLVNDHKSGKLSHADFCAQIDRVYEEKQRGKPELLETLHDPETLEMCPTVLEIAENALEHMEQGFELFFQYAEEPDQKLLDSAIKKMKTFVDLMNNAHDTALDISEEAESGGIL